MFPTSMGFGPSHVFGSPHGGRVMPLARGYWRERCVLLRRLVASQELRDSSALAPAHGRRAAERHLRRAAAARAGGSRFSHRFEATQNSRREGEG